MKLYTEEQVKRLIAFFNFGMPEISVLDDLKITPIELPSDEEINDKAHKVHDDKFNEFYAFEDGAKWMREQIQKQIQKQLLSEIMKADENDGLYNNENK